MHTLKSLRIFCRMNQREWAEALGVSLNTVHNWENGKTEPTLTVLHRMSDLSGVSIDDISPCDSSKLNGGEE